MNRLFCITLAIFALMMGALGLDFWRLAIAYTTEGYGLIPTVAIPAALGLWALPIVLAAIFPHKPV